VTRIIAFKLLFKLIGIMSQHKMHLVSQPFYNSLVKYRKMLYVEKQNESLDWNRYLRSRYQWISGNKLEIKCQEWLKSERQSWRSIKRWVSKQTTSQTAVL